MRKIYIIENTVSDLKSLLNSIPWGDSNYRSLAPIKNYIFRIANKRELEAMIKNNVWSGAFWDTDPANHGRLGMDDESIMMVSTTNKTLSQHNVITDRKGIEDIVAVFKWEGPRLYGEWGR